MKKQQISISVLFIFLAALISGCTPEHVRVADYKAMAAGYGDTINDGNLVYGNSTSWISVEAFYQYAGKNTGSGFVAMTESLYYAGEVGFVEEIKLR